MGKNIGTFQLNSVGISQHVFVFLSFFGGGGGYGMLFIMGVISFILL